MIMGIVYGYEPTSIEDEWIRRSKEGVAAFRECMRSVSTTLLISNDLTVTKGLARG